VIARSVPVTDPSDDLKFQREYPTANLFGGITGYTTFNYGSTQLERSQGPVLLGTTSKQKVRALTDLLTGQDPSGSVVLTMRADVQQVAKDALGDREGSVVVMDPTTGAILAMYSFPNFDPNQVATHDSGAAADVLDFLNAYPGKPLLTNAYQERYMPGSSFKVITTGIAFENGLDSVFGVETAYTPPQTTDPVQNYGGSACGGTMAEVFFRSCNIPFARMAIELGPERMVAGTQAWGIGEKIPIDRPGAVASSFGTVDDFTDRLPLLAIGGFGQGSDVMVPLHMAMVASTVAYGGEMMTPHVVDVTRYHDGTVLERTEPSVWKTPISADTAARTLGARSTERTVDIAARWVDRTKVAGISTETARRTPTDHPAELASRETTPTVGTTAPAPGRGWVVFCGFGLILLAGFGLFASRRRASGTG
jgi:peptidoglycan glycosyltransferase